MLWQMRDVDLYQIGFHVLDNAITHCRREEIDDRRVDLSRRRERPAFDGFGLHDIRDVIRQLPEQTAVVFRLQSLPFGDAVEMAAAARLPTAVAYREAP